MFILVDSEGYVIATARSEEELKAKQLEAAKQK